MAALGGCIAGGSGDGGDDPGTDGPDGSTTDSPSPTPQPTDATTDGPGSAHFVDVRDVVVRKAVTYESTMGSGGVLAADGRQYVVATVRGEAIPEGGFVLDADGRTWEPGLPDTRGGINYSVAGHEGGPLGRSLGSGQGSFLAFAVPSPLSASDVRIRAADADEPAWPLPDAERERLAAPEPRFELDAFEAPAEVSQGHPLSVTLSATNVTDVGGRFLAAVYWPTELVADDDESRLVEREVAAGESVSATLDLDTEYTTAESGPMPLSVRGHVDVDREVTVTDASRPE